MRKRNVYILVLTLIVALAWVGYVVYNNLHTVDYAHMPDESKYTTYIDPQLHLDAFDKVVSSGQYIKVSDASLSSQ